MVSPKPLYHFTFPQQRVRAAVSHILANRYCFPLVTFFDSSHPNGCEVASRCSFGLHPTNDE